MFYLKGHIVRYLLPLMLLWPSQGRLAIVSLFCHSYLYLPTIPSCLSHLCVFSIWHILFCHSHLYLPSIFSVLSHLCVFMNTVALLGGLLIIVFDIWHVSNLEGHQYEFLNVGSTASSYFHVHVKN